MSSEEFSKRIDLLEADLGVPLYEHGSAVLNLTAAGRQFISKTKSIVARIDKICDEIRSEQKPKKAVFTIGWLKNYGGEEYRRAISAFEQKYPDVEINIRAASHSELERLLRSDSVNLALCDGAIKYDSDCAVMPLSIRKCEAELCADDPAAECDFLNTARLRYSECIIVSQDSEFQSEEKITRELFGVLGHISHAYTLDDARLEAISRKGFIPICGGGIPQQFRKALVRRPLVSNGKPLFSGYYAVWNKDGFSEYSETFAGLLLEEFVK